MKTSKRIVSFVLSAIMVVTTFLAVGPVFTINAEAADITLGGITQKHVVSDYATKYAQYQKEYFKGAETNWPTDIVIPGLGEEDYTPQGMTYWKEKGWILISAYDAGDGTKNSVIYALDVKTGDFVALFKIFNRDGSVNTSHGGGIAASEYNFYYADKNSDISYWPLDYMDIELNSDVSKNVKNITIVDTIDCSSELNSAATSYCCYDEGVLWTGNFYFSGDSRYTTKAYGDEYPSALMGYTLKGSSPEEEWATLKAEAMTQSNLLQPIKTGALTSVKTENTLNYNVSVDSNGYIDITGDAIFNSGNAENAPFYARAYLVDGTDYKLEFDLKPDSSAMGDEMFMTDMYFINEGSTGLGYSNIKYSVGSSAMVKEDNGDGTYHFTLNFTFGEKMPGSRMDGNWHNIENPNGNYKVRFDIDTITADRHFEITNIRLNKVDGNYVESPTIGEDCAGNPSYCVLFNNQLDRVQYAMVDKGKIYISRSWSRYDSTNHVRALAIGDLDIYAPGDITTTVAGKNRECFVVGAGDVTQFSGNKMLWMGEALCIIDDYLFMFGESAAYSYRVEKSNDHVCEYPIDVIWKIDQYAIMGAPRSATEDIEASHYEKVTDLSQLDGKSEYIVVYESAIKDRVTQNNILYLLDSYGGYNGAKLPKVDSPTQGNTGDSMGMVGYKVTSYSKDGDKLYIDDMVDARKSVRWTISSSGEKIKLANSDYYYAQNQYFVFNYEAMSMTTSATEEYEHIKAVSAGNGKFYIYSTYAQNSKEYPSYLWCNDGSDPDNTYLSKYTQHYAKASSNKVYYGAEEVAGTFHIDALHAEPQYSGNVVTNANQPIHNDNGVYPAGMFTFYKRVPDPYAYTGDSQVYTSLKTDIQYDGSINLQLETYATASLHYKTLPEAALKNRPMDYVFVIDTSGSMDGTAAQKGWQYYGSSNPLSIGSVTGHSKGGPYDSDGTGLETKDDPSDIYIRRSDGEMALIYGAVYTKEYNKGFIGIGFKITQYYWAYYQEADGSYRVLRENSSTPYTLTKDQLYSDINNGTGTYRSASSSSTSGSEARAGERVYTGEHYAANREISRPQEISNAVSDFMLEVAKNAKDTGLNHRVAIVKCGSLPTSDSTGFFTAGTTTFNEHVTGYNTQSGYDNVFYEVSQFNQAISGIQSRTKAGGHSYIDYGMHMASEIIKASVAKGVDYTYNGNRRACVIVITDGGMTADENKSNDGSVSIAQSAAHYAYAAKQNGASVYTWQYGTSNVPNFDSAQYLSYLSMEYIDARLAMVNKSSTFQPGAKNPHPVEYNVAYGSGDGATPAKMLNYVNENSKYSLAKLDTNAILREQLNKRSFSLSGLDNSDIVIGTQKATIDAIGNISYGELDTSDSSLKADITNKANGEILVKGYDYSKNYISTATCKAGTAKKLVITIKDVDFASGVVNDNTVDGPIVDIPISEAYYTGIYQNKSDMDSEIKHRSFPEDRITIPQYTYVCDYGMEMLDVDINGTLKSVDTQLRKQSTYSDHASSEGTSITFANNSQDMIYKIDRTATGLQRYYVLIQRPNDEYDWFAINIVPASTVYYEENIFSNYISGNTRWSRTGNATVTNQGISLWDDVYGYDEKYLADTSNNSGGTVLTTTVSSGNKQSDTYRTNFIGDAFDLYSACGDSTGILVVGVRKNDGTNNGRGTLVKSYVVDTFYNDSAYGTLYQVPVIHCEDLAYGNYFVEITSAYLSISGKLRSQSIATEIIDENGVISYTSDFTNDTESVILEELGFAELDPENTEFIWYSEDSVLNGGMGAQGVNNGSFTTQADGDVTLTSYIDGLRAYNPTNGVSSYYKAEEQDAKYYNVFDNMKAGTFTGNGVSYLLGGTAGGTTLNFATELESLFQGRPKNEVYLENGNKITFTVNGLDTDSRVMVSLRAAAGTPKASVNNKQFNVTSKMEMYYDVTDYVTKSSDGKSATVIIENVSGGMLAIDNIKLTGKETTLSGQSLLSDIIEIFAEPVEEVVPNQPKPQVSENSGEIPAPPELPDVSDPDDGNDDNGNDDIVPPSDDNNNPEEPAEDGFFTKVESFFVEIFNFFKNIFNKVSSFFKF